MPERRTRFLNNNLITAASMVTPSSVAGGRYTGLRRTDALGYANLKVLGSFIGNADTDYLIEILTGGEVGVATYRWSDDDGTTIIASGITTSLTAQSLNNGVEIEWFSGVGGTDFVSGDIWRFRAYLPWGANRMLDRDRDTEYRSGTTSQTTLTIDLGAAETPTVFALLDHNLRLVGGSLRLQGSSNNFASVAVDYIIPIREGGAIVHYLDDGATYRYWRVAVSDPGNPAGYLRWSELYLGTYYQTPRRLELGDLLARMRVVERGRALTGRWTNTVPKTNRALNAEFIFLPEDDREEIFLAFERLFNQSLFRTGPVLFHPDSSDPDTFLLAQWPDMAASKSMEPSPERYEMALKFFEVPRTI